MKTGNETKKVKPGLKLADQQTQKTKGVFARALPLGEGDMYVQNMPSAKSDTISNFMDEGGMEQYLKGATRRPFAKPPTPAKKINTSVIDNIANKYKNSK